MPVTYTVYYDDKYKHAKWVVETGCIVNSNLFPPKIDVFVIKGKLRATNFMINLENIKILILVDFIGKISITIVRGLLLVWFLHLLSELYSIHSQRVRACSYA